MENKEQTTTIQITNTVWVEIQRLKRIGETYNDVLLRLLFQEPDAFPPVYDLNLKGGLENDKPNKMVTLENQE